MIRAAREEDVVEGCRIPLVSPQAHCGATAPPPLHRVLATALSLTCYAPLCVSRALRKPVVARFFSCGTRANYTASTSTAATWAPTCLRQT
jgi:hypothetical protein